MEVATYFMIKYKGHGFIIESDLDIGSIVFEDEKFYKSAESYLAEHSVRNMRYVNNIWVMPFLFRSEKLAELFINNEIVPRIMTKIFSENLNIGDLLYDGNN